MMVAMMISPVFSIEECFHFATPSSLSNPLPKVPYLGALFTTDNSFPQCCGDDTT